MFPVRTWTRGRAQEHRRGTVRAAGGREERSAPRRRDHAGQGGALLRETVRCGRSESRRGRCSRIAAGRRAGGSTAGRTTRSRRASDASSASERSTATSRSAETGTATTCQASIDGDVTGAGVQRRVTVRQGGGDEAGVGGVAAEDVDDDLHHGESGEQARDRPAAVDHGTDADGEHDSHQQ